jgi:hypothetical protein
MGGVIMAGLRHAFPINEIVVRQAAAAASLRPSTTTVFNLNSN